MNNIPLDINNKDSVAAFGAEAARAYQTRELALKKKPDQKVDKKQFIDGIFKLKRNIDRINKDSEVYKAYRTGANLFNFRKQQDSLGPTKTKKVTGPPKRERSETVEEADDAEMLPGRGIAGFSQQLSLVTQLLKINGGKFTQVTCGFRNFF